MNPQNITLTKIKTLDEALYPQKEQYPDGYEKSGLMWEWSKPKVGEPFYVMYDKLHSNFRTSPVEEIISETESTIVFKTLNSMYKIAIQ